MVLPKEVRDWLEVEEGQSVVFQIDETGVRVVNSGEFARSTLGAFSGVWGKNPQDADKYLDKQRASWEKL